MKLKNFILLELWKMNRNKRLLGFLIIEIAAIAIPMFDISNETLLTSDIYLSPYMGVSLTFRFIYSAIVIAQLFSKDIENGITNTYIACGISKRVILYGKMICAWIILLLCTFFSFVVYAFICFVMNLTFSFDGISIASIILTMVPLFINTILLIIIDTIFESAFITVFTAISFVITSNFLPNSVGRWIYITYSNPITTLLYQDTPAIIRMVGVFVISFAVLFYILDRSFVKCWR